MKKSKFKFLRTLFLKPFSLLWEFVYFWRRASYDYGIFKQASFEVPIISVGNLSFGGTGKTPFTLWLSEYLHQKNLKTMVLMRGYKGKFEHKSGVIESGKKINPDPSDFGDEAILLARRMTNSTIVVGKNRSQNLNFYFNKYEPDVVLLDDGHQHLQLKRKCNLVLFDATMPIEEYELAPLGYLREGLTSLKDADAVIIGRVDQVKEEKLLELKKLIRPYLPFKIPIAEVGYRPSGLFNSSQNLIFNLPEIREKKIILLAGVANPKSFFKIMEDLGAEILVTESFPDHHYFKREEIDPLLSYAKAEDAYLVTTEKDMVRIKNIIEDDAILFLQIDLKFYSGEDEIKTLVDRIVTF
jgi:tetraacyldisaccharide 4'-kinase